MRKPAPLSKLVRLTYDGYSFRNWYVKINDDIHKLCNREHWSVRRFTSILALTSPRCSLRRNVRVTLCYEGQGELPRNVIKSVRASLLHWEVNREIRGQKTLSFYEAILGNTDAIVIDSWIMRAVFGNIGKPIPSRPELRVACDVIRDLASEVGLTPAETQAALWCGIINEYGRNAAYAPILDEYELWIKYNRRFPLSGEIAA